MYRVELKTRDGMMFEPYWKSLWEETDDDDQWTISFSNITLISTNFDSSYPELLNIDEIELFLDVNTMEISGKLYFKMDKHQLPDFYNKPIVNAGESLPIVVINFSDSYRDLELTATLFSKQFSMNPIKTYYQVIVHSITEIHSDSIEYLEEYYVNGKNISPLKFNGSYSYDEELNVKQSFSYHGTNRDFDSRQSIPHFHSFNNAMIFEYMESPIIIFQPDVKRLKENGFTVVLYVDNIPDSNTRKNLSNLISFYCGSHLISVGEAAFSDGYCSHSMIKAAMRYSKEKNVHNWSPILDSVSINNFMNDVIPTYFEIVDSYDLNLFFTAYWRALSLEIDVASTQLIVCFEHIADRMVKNEIISNLILDRNSYKILYDKCIDSIEPSRGTPEYDVLSKCLQNCNRKSKRELRKEVCQLLNVELNDKRNQAYNSAMNLKHAEYPTDEKSLFSDFITTLEFVNEVILKLLHYSGQPKHYFESLK